MQQADARNLIESDILNLEGGQSNHGYQESNKPAPVTRRLRTATAASK